MRKYLLATVFLVLFVCFMGPTQTLISSLLRLDHPTFHKIEEGQWLSKIAKEYYGDTSYWHELELINRAPDGNRIYPGEQIIVPSFGVVERIRAARRLSDVNRLVSEQQDILARNQPAREDIRSEQEVEVAEHLADGAALTPVTPKDPIVVQPEEVPQAEALPESVSRVSEFLLFGIVLLIVAFVAGIVLYIRTKKKEEVAYYGGQEGEREVDEQTTGLPSNIFLDLAGEHRQENEEKRKEENNGVPVT